VRNQARRKIDYEDDDDDEDDKLVIIVRQMTDWIAEGTAPS
jgi:hypothetical protein